MSFTLVVAILFVLFGGLAWAYSLAEDTRKSNWSDLARHLGLKYQRGNIIGALDGIPVSVWQEQRGLGRHRHDVICFRSATTGRFPRGLLLEREGVTKKLSKLVGTQDVQLDLPNVDSKLMVQAFSEPAVHDWAQNPEVAAGLAELVAVKGLSVFKVDEHAVYFEVLHAVDDMERLEAYLRQITSIARLLSEEAPAPAPPSRPRPVEPIEIPVDNQPW